MANEFHPPMELDWLFEEDLMVTVYGMEISEPRLLVTDAGRRWAVMLKFEEDNNGDTVCLANGMFYDFGDEYPVIWGIFDGVSALEESMTTQGQEHYLARAEISSGPPVETTVDDAVAMYRNSLEEYDEPTEELGV